MSTLRRPALLAATALTALLALYIAVVAGRALTLIAEDAWIAKALGVSFLVLPVVASWYLWQEWRLGMGVQRMGSALEAAGRLPVHEGPRTPSGRLAPEAASVAYEAARLWLDGDPDNWEAWFHVAAGYDVMGDRSQARRAYRHAADLFRAAARRGAVSRP